MRRRKSGLNFNRSHEKKKINFPLIREITAWVIEIVIVLVLAFVLVYFVGLRTSVVGKSMEPTLLPSDEILVDRFIYKLIDPRRDDVVVFLPNGNEKSHFYVKRVVGVPGDTIQIERGTLLVNGAPYSGEASFDGIDDAGVAAEELTLGADEYFVLGDDTESSEDSRYANIGNISKNYVIGKVWFIVNPSTRRGFL